NEATINRVPFADGRAAPADPLLFGPELSWVVEAEKPIRGAVTEADTGRPRTGVTVRLTDDERRPLLSATTAADGRYEIRRARKAKAYELAGGSDPGAGLLGRRVTVPDTAGYEPVTADIAAARGVVVTGRIIDAATGRGLRGFATVGVLSDNP